MIERLGKYLANRLQWVWRSATASFLGGSEGTLMDEWRIPMRKFAISRAGL